ncbi:MAG: outer membrane beta-barrel protein [Pyrinomonadaceae bacterium]
MKFSYKKIISGVASTTVAVLLTITTSSLATTAQTPATTDSTGASTAPVRAASDNDTWKGFYVGAYSGGGFNRSNVATSTVFSSTGYFQQTSVNAINAAGVQQVKPNGFTGGGTFGYNYQSGALVVGAELDFGAMNANKGVSSSGTYPCCGTARFTINQATKTRWLMTVRPRVGVAVGNAMIYGTGGLAVTDVNYAATFTDTYGNATESAAFKKNKAGWTLGGGAEVKVASRWSIKGEYLYTDFGSISVTSNNLNAASIASIANTPNIPGPSVAYTQNVFTHSSDLRTNNVRFGVNFHF